MLGVEEFNEWCDEMRLSEQARVIINKIRSSEPSRRVGGGSKNFIGIYPSGKMGLGIQFESRTAEFSAIYLMEHNPDVLEYYDQPNQIKLNYESLKGKVVGVNSTPDFFVISRGSAGWVEWKTENDLNVLAQKSPNRYVRENDGWRCPPGEDFAGKFGLTFSLLSSQSINRVLERNLRFLEDYYRTSLVVPDESFQKIRDMVDSEFGVTLDRLIFESGVPSDYIFMLIVNEAIYVDISKSLLAEPENARVFLEKQMAEGYEIISKHQSTSLVPMNVVDLNPGTVMSWEGNRWTVVNVGEAVSLIDEQDQMVSLPKGTLINLLTEQKVIPLNDLRETNVDRNTLELLQSVGPEHYAVANKRHEIVVAVLAGQATDQFGIPARTVRSWIRNFKIAEELYGSGYYGLLPHYYKRGNRNMKLPKETIVLMNHFIEEVYETPVQQSQIIVYGKLLNECEEKGIIAPSLKTFHTAIKNRPQKEQIEERQGKKVAYNSEEFYWELEQTTPRHGDRPLEIVHIDHTPLPIRLLDSKTGKVIDRSPWMTMMMDANTRRYLGIYLTFDKPSINSCMMVIRDCVRRFSRMPSIIVTDNGKEFKSVYYEALLARYLSTPLWRSAGRPRGGSVCERLFGTSQTQFINNLEGNTQAYKNHRQLTKAVDPEEHAIWTLELLYESLCEWAFEIYDTTIHPALGQTPREAFQLGLVLSGKRDNKIILYDKEFEIWTSPTTRTGTAKVSATHGVQINGRKYWNKAFRIPKVAGTLVNVRYDPFDIGIAYARVENKWVEGISEYYSVLKGKSMHEIKIISEEIRMRLGRKNLKITAKHIATYMLSLEGKQKVMRQQQNDSEVKPILKLINGCMGQSDSNERGPSEIDTSSSVEDEMMELEEYEEY